MKTRFLTRTFLFSAVLALTTYSCRQQAKQPDESDVTTAAQETTSQTRQGSGVAGNYVSESYGQRGEGYDWVGVRVKDIADGRIWVSVRSRADRKKPTCTFDGEAYHTEGDTYHAMIGGGQEIEFHFSEGNLVIAPALGTHEDALFFFCSGGATLSGTYTRIEGDLDASQVDKTVFMKYLTLQDVAFNVSVEEENGRQMLTIRSMGLPGSDNDPVKMEVPGEILGAEIEDLNSDGAPEVVVFSRFNGKGQVNGISCNGKNSMSMFYFPPLENNPEASQGYTGGDEFALVETYLAQRFPLANGKTRQIQYKLVNGENSRVFEVSNISEY